MRVLPYVCIVLGVTLSAQALMVESESNDTVATANPIPVGARPWSELGVMSLTAPPGGHDVDYFLLSLELNDLLSVESTPVQPMFSSPDTRLGLFDAGGGLLVADINSPNPGAISTLVYRVPASGVYYLAVTGGTDLDFVGQHAQWGSYVLSASITPEPATLALLGLGALAWLRRPRR